LKRRFSVALYKFEIEESLVEKSTTDEETSQIFLTAIQSTPKCKTPLEKLLDISHQNALLDMSDIFKMYYYDYNYSYPTLKIGEASYSDVYLIDDEDTPQAVKVIPLAGKDQLSFDDAFLEINSTFATSNIKLRPGDKNPYNYIKLYSVAICQGPYDSNLVKLWDEYDDQSENINPS
jgi:hypothetical protein